MQVLEWIKRVTDLIKKQLRHLLKRLVEFSQSNWNVFISQLEFS